MIEDGSFDRFGSGEYFLMLALLLFARGTDVLSTWIATPNLLLEGNPLAKFLGWRWGIPFNLAFCAGFALWPLPAVVVSTTSVLVAAHNFQRAWLMRSLGEESYRDWHVARMQETRVSLYLFCLLGETMLTGVVGGALLYFSGSYPVPMAIGWGIITYAAAVTIFTLLSVWRIRRPMS